MSGGGFQSVPAIVVPSPIPPSGVNVFTPIDGVADDTANFITYCTNQIAVNQSFYLADPLGVGFVFSNLVNNAVYTRAPWIPVVHNNNNAPLIKLSGTNNIYNGSGINNFRLTVNSGTTNLQGFSSGGVYIIPELTINNGVTFNLSNANLTCQRVQRIGGGSCTFTISGRSIFITDLFAMLLADVVTQSGGSIVSICGGSGPYNLSGTNAKFAYGSWTLVNGHNLTVTGLYNQIKGGNGFWNITCLSVSNYCIFNLGRVQNNVSVKYCTFNANFVNGSVTCGDYCNVRVIYCNTLVVGNNDATCDQMTIEAQYIVNLNFSAISVIRSLNLVVNDIEQPAPVVNFQNNNNIFCNKFKIGSVEPITLNNVAVMSCVFEIVTFTGVTVNLNVSATNNKFIITNGGVLVGGGAGNVILT